MSDLTEQSAQQEGQEEEPTVIFTGNPTFVGKHRTRKSGKQIIDFGLATHPEEGKTENSHSAVWFASFGIFLRATPTAYRRG